MPTIQYKLSEPRHNAEQRKCRGYRFTFRRPTIRILKNARTSKATVPVAPDTESVGTNYRPNLAVPGAQFFGSAKVATDGASPRLFLIIFGDEMISVVVCQARRPTGSSGLLDASCDGLFAAGAATFLFYNYRA